MPCIKFDFTISNDRDGRLRKSVMYAAANNEVVDYTKATLFAGLIQTEGFEKYVKEELKKSGQTFTNLADINANSMRKYLREYYNIHHTNVNNTIAKEQAEALNGFTSSNAKNDAITYTSDIILDVYDAEMSKPREERLSYKQMIVRTRNLLQQYLRNDVFKEVVRRLKDDKYSDNATIKERLDKYEAAYNSFVNAVNEYKKFIKDPKNKNSDKAKELLNKGKELDRQYTIIASNLVRDYKSLTGELNGQELNFLNLVEQVERQPKKWFTLAFQNQKLTSLVNSFIPVLEDEKLYELNASDEEDHYNAESSDIDETAKSWENSQYSSFTKHVDISVKRYLGKLKHLISTEKVNGKYQYDKEHNELGVATSMHPDYLVAQICSRCQFTSINNFINSIEHLAKMDPSLYGLIKLVDDMRTNPIFANKMFHELNNPSIVKLQAVISEAGIEMLQSNTHAAPMASLIYSMMNNARNNVKDYFTEEDVDKLKEISDTFKKLGNNLAEWLNVEKEVDKTKDGNPILKTNAAIVLDQLYDVLYKYFPSITKSTVRNYLFSDTIQIDNKFKNFTNEILDLLNTARVVKNDYNNVLDKYYKDVRTYKNAHEIGAVNIGERPVLDLSKVNYDKLNSNIIKIAKALMGYGLIKTELNSTNAEGNMSSDLMKNSFLSNLMEQIKYGTAEDVNKGLQNLGEFLNKSEQTRYNPFYFGVTDSKGKVIQKGLFERVGNTIKVNPEAKSMIGIQLFDGTRDSLGDKSAMYTGMSKADYFLTWLYAYHQPVDDSNEYYNKQEFKDSFAGFFLRTPSDAPKNFIFRTKKYDTSSLWLKDNVGDNNYINSVAEKLIKKYNFTTEGVHVDASENIILDNSKRGIAKISSKEAYTLLNDGIVTYNYGKNKVIENKETGKISVPIVVSETDGTISNNMIIWITGNPNVNDKTQLSDVTIEEIYTNNDVKSLLHFVREQVIEEGVYNGSIKRNINKENPLFRALYAHALGEINTFIFNLNNVLDSENEFRSKDDTKLLIDRAHYKGTIVENGELTGNFFKFLKLFKTNGYDASAEIKSLLSLYGQSNPLLIANADGTISLNQNRTDIINITDGTISLNSANIAKGLEDIVAKWISAFQADIVANTKPFEHIIAERFTYSEVVDCMLNSAVMEMSFDDILEGDVKFYKDAQDFLKRAKEVQAGGKSYASFDLNDPIGGALYDKEDIAINSQPLLIPRKGNPSIKSILKIRNGFVGVTIANTVNAAQSAGNIKTELNNILKDKVGEKEAERISSDIAAGYFANSKFNDAQSYITFEEWIRRRYADGTLNQYQDLINQILEVRTGVKQLKDIDLKGINARIQVDKNFYFDKQYDPNTGSIYARQIKNAEFVIIPELVAGTELETLYDIMIENGIDQLNTAETDKAAKRVVLNYWDNNGVAHPDEFRQQLEDKRVTENYYYRYLYKQQEVPEHMKDQRNKAGIQIMKKMLDNANESVKPHIKKLMDNYTANIKDSFNTLLTEMGWAVAEDGSLKNAKNPNAPLDFSEFYNKARVEAQRLGLDSNFIEYLTPVNFGQPSMPNYMNNVSTKLESIAQSIFNNAITRQTLPGWHAAQVTSIGHGAKVLDSTGEFRKLKYHPKVVDENGNVKQEAYAEVLIPRWSNLIPKDYDISKLAEEGLDIHIGYRIPTEGKQSVSILKVVGFIDDIYGSTIMVPDEWVTQTGSDFDVDSIYGICYEIYKDENNVLHKITEEYAKNHPDKLRSARNNNILDAMVAIMKDSNSREENYSRSNFDDLSDAMGRIKSMRGDNKASTSAYNPFDQIKFMENAISGRKLKAFSVTRDTFASICNFIGASLSEKHGIKVTYDLSKYDINIIKAAYDQYEEDKENNTVTVTHTNIGNSKNNRNVIGKLLTVYSSQTTAHILDAIKEGAIPNENEYTFGTFKTLVDVGIDYDTAIAFLMQPVMTRIVEANNESNSIYTNASSDAVNVAIKRIAKDLGILVNDKEIDDYTNINSVWYFLNKNKELKKAFSELFSGSFDYSKPLNEQVVAIDNKVLENRLKGVDSSNNPLSEYDKAAIDIAYALVFDKIHETTKNIEAIARCVKSDSFGAKQTIHETRNIYDDIINYISNSTNEINNTIVDRNGVPLLNSIYPGIGTEKGIDVEKSSYGYLASFFKYATQASVEANSQLFITESKQFVELTKKIEEKLNRRLKPNEYKELKQYIVHHTYLQVPMLLTPITINDLGFITYDINRIKDIADKINKPIKLSNEDTIENKELATLTYVNGFETVTDLYEQELFRIYGYDITESSNIDIVDVNNPTEEEIAAFNRLTPAQKVIFIQQHFDDPGIFDNLRVNLFNKYERKNKGYTSQSIRFNDQIENIEEMFKQFNNAFFNKNELCRLAAIDLVKYAFIVEGFKFKKGSISKIITNKSIKGDLTNKGFGIIDAVEQAMKIYNDTANLASDDFIDKFVRSHSEIIKEVNIPKKGNVAKQLATASTGQGILFIPFDSDNYGDLLEKVTLSAEDTKGYIKLRRTVNGVKKVTLYKIKKYDSGVYLLPMNILDKNEQFENSVNNANNIHKHIGYYTALVDFAENNKVKINKIEETEEGRQLIEEWKPNFTIPRREFKKSIESAVNDNALITLLNSNNNVMRAAVNHFITDVNNTMKTMYEATTPVEGYVYVHNNTHAIKELFPKGIAVLQNFPTGGVDNVTNKYLVTQIDTPRGIRKKKPTNNAESNLLAKMEKSNTKYPIVYKIEPVVDNKAKEEYEKATKKANDKAKTMYAITSLIPDAVTESDNSLKHSAGILKNIITHVKSIAIKNIDPNANYFMDRLNILGVDIESNTSLIDNSKNIYELAADYFKRHSIRLKEQIDKFECSDGNTYSIDDPVLYQKLREYPEDYFRLVNVILEAKTFGGVFYDIFNLDLEGEDKLTTVYIEELRNAINRIRNSNRLNGPKGALNLLFNDYIANEFSTNPMIRNGFVKLTETFGDTNWFDLNFADIGDLNHKQVQTIVKLVYGILNDANTILAPKKVLEFETSYDNIMKLPGDFNINNIIDEEGKLIQDFNEQFLKDRNKHIDDTKEARETYGIYSKEHFKALVERDKWRLKYTHQELNDNYYEKKIKIRDVAYAVAGDDFLKYLQLRFEYFKDGANFEILSEEKRKEKEKILEQINTLKSDIVNGELKNDVEVYKAAAIRNYETAMKELDKEYFNYDERLGFKEVVEYYTDIIDEYKRKHPHESISRRLQDASYKEAYDWLAANTNYRLTQDAHDKLKKAFDNFLPNSNTYTSKSRVKAILNSANAFDKFGIVDGSKLSKEQIEAIRTAYILDYNTKYGDNVERISLIKDVPIDNNVYDDAIYAKLKHSSDNFEYQKKKRAIVNEINPLISKGLDSAGRIDTKLLFDNLTEEELNKLANLYQQLRDLREVKEKDVAYGKRITKMLKDGDISFETSDAYDINLLERNNLTAKQRKLWDKIFKEIDAKTGAVKANRDIFGYIKINDKYKNKEKTEARALIEESIYYEPTEYYYQEREKARQAGKDAYKEWYELNHLYNPYTKKVEPLRIWTTMKVHPEGKLKGSYNYQANFENTRKTIADGMQNDSYVRGGFNYKPIVDENTNKDINPYHNNKILSDKERKMKELFTKTMKEYVLDNTNSSHAMKSFVLKGFMPRRANPVTDSRWYAKQIAGIIGLGTPYGEESTFNDLSKFNYENDSDIEFDMLKILKARGYQDIKPIPKQEEGESNKDYHDRIKPIKEENEKIKENNLKLENAIRDSDWKGVMVDFIRKAIDYNAKVRAKNSIYLLLEDLKERDAYALSGYSNNVVETKQGYKTTSQENTYKLVENWGRRVIRGEFKKNNKFSRWADMLQNITSAKYMIFNVTGGIANIGTGTTNILGEAIAKDYFDNKTWKQAQHEYLTNSLNIIADTYNVTSKNETAAILKYMDVVNLDNFIERRNDESVAEYTKRVRNSLYAFQSGGEHYMQNTVLLAMMRSHKLFKDIDGTYRLGSLNHYIWRTEMDTMIKLLESNPEELKVYKDFIKTQNADLKKLKQYDSFNKDYNESFLRPMRKTKEGKEFIEKYIKARQEAINKAKEEFSKLSSLRDNFTVDSDGIAHIKEDSNITEKMIADFKTEVEAVNKEIHGVYDKIGAAKIEAEWWGGLVMQYHKHIYPGIMKRWRKRGYYNELRGSIERGSYQALGKFLTSEFRDFGERVGKEKETGASVAIASLKVLGQSIVDTVVNFGLNYQMMPIWERNAMRKCLADLMGVVNAFLIAMAIHMGTDDDEIKDSEFLATMIYMADRLNSEAQMYAPWGLYTEFSTLWSSPIAAQNGPKDLIKAFNIGIQAIFDEDFNIEYTTGLYKGQNKLEVLLYRNTPAYRVYQRLSNMTKNNSYYRINESAFNIKFAKTIADTVNPD